LTFGAACRFQLNTRVAGPDVAGSLEELLSRWRDHLARVPEFSGEDTAAMVTWPSRDVCGAAALLRHGLTPLAVIAARASGRHPARYQAGLTGETARSVRVRRATADDIDAVVQLGLETIRFDARLGGVIERPDTSAALRRRAGVLLTGPEPWTWLAERDGTPVGMVCVEPPEATGWIASMTAASPVAYILLMSVMAGERGDGIGAAMAARAHREIDAAGVAVTLLHYSLPNPLAVPFWGAQAYRPLWTLWEARPAAALR